LDLNGVCPYGPVGRVVFLWNNGDMGGRHSTGRGSRAERIRSWGNGPVAGRP
jgi:hypothetical protein